MIIFAAYVGVFIFMTMYFILTCMIKVKLGKPPLDRLLIAYKYSCFSIRSNFKFLNKSKFSRKTHKFIKFCYSSTKDNHTEYAQGVVLSENDSPPELSSVYEAKGIGLNFFKTPAISHAIYMEFPNLLWFPITRLFSVLIGYPSIRRFAEEKNLCGYPVIEIHSAKSVTIIVPLVMQDAFIVNEARSIVFGKYYSFHELLSKFSNSVFTQTDNRSSKELSLKSFNMSKRIMKG